MDDTRIIIIVLDRIKDNHNIKQSELLTIIQNVLYIHDAKYNHVIDEKQTRSIYTKVIKELNHRKAMTQKQVKHIRPIKDINKFFIKEKKQNIFIKILKNIKNPKG